MLPKLIVAFLNFLYFCLENIGIIMCFMNFGSLFDMAQAWQCILGCFFRGHLAWLHMLHMERSPMVNMETNLEQKSPVERVECPRPGIRSAYVPTAY